MDRTFKAAVATLILAVSFLAGSVAAGPLEDAWAAYEKGDYPTALRLLRPLANFGAHAADAQFVLGLMYDNGQGVPQDYAAAGEWYRKSAEQGNAFAQGSLGYQYANGRGVKQDYAAAVEWYRKSAEQGVPIGQLALGAMYADGKGVPQDYVLAHMWFNLAAAGGNKNAVKGRDMVATQMTPAQIAEAQKLAREWKPTPAPH
jgi:uncharacterized protein